MILIYVLLAVWVWASLLYGFFLAYVTLNRARLNGKLAAAPLPVKVVGWTIFLIAVVLDVVFNLVVGSLIFLELPNLSRPTFSQRCSAYMQHMSWRGRIARWVCTGWLNPFDENHC